MLLPENLIQKQEKKKSKFLIELAKRRAFASSL
jgi:hypothetical protein